jgi:hypothetical protein
MISSPNPIMTDRAHLLTELRLPESMTSTR